MKEKPYCNLFNQICSNGVADEDALLEALAAAYPHMNTDELEAALTQMLFISSVLGRLHTESELSS